MSTNNTWGWKVENPEWQDYSKQICTKEHCWYGVYGTAFWMSKGLTVDRIMLSYPNIAEHFYYLWMDSYTRDIIFGTYDIEELKKFIGQLGWKSYYSLYISDKPQNKRYKIVKQNNIQEDGYDFTIKEWPLFENR